MVNAMCVVQVCTGMFVFGGERIRSLCFFLVVSYYYYARYKPTALIKSTNNTFLVVIGTYQMPPDCAVYDSVVTM